ncbi:alpha/beta fold hydrolase [Enterococcus cecorum]|uniref:alpha/beta fold hydrolase n=1 Tax=Enterococcus cecorum TaxID=44008 RepID=UPI001FAD31B8|nr:alpha/beta fold hydrolase [Enterococcus cecorum]MCJ0594553.1 alpha/beta fold hydrolase [Enterococcus cecorum]MCJ0596268.1 alpha/beta fold hydrolase [Enterococcus cecorum]MCJ0601406.1 alpha/beta fold hydrolase [Enterococcus cecorum]MCJ0606280.1 alpha/beta fold hydrolase [Enterococcus cecorum]
MKKQLYHILGLLAVGVMIVLLWFFWPSNKETAPKVAHSNHKQVTSTQNEVKSYPVTLFFHGYGGTKHSMGGMIQRLSSRYQATHTLDLTVNTDGTIQTSGTFEQADKPVLINVLFADNKNNEWNQAEWIYQSLQFVKAQYHVEKVNVVGHSMGGVSLFRFLETYQNQGELPTVEHFISIAAPLNEFLDTSNEQSVDGLLQQGPTQISPRYQDFQNNIANFPKNVQVSLFAGQLSASDLSDGTVPLTSALAVNQLLSSQQIPVETFVFKGVLAQHSALHANPKVDKRIVEILWK